MSKPINFKPSGIDQSLIDAIQAQKKYKTTAELLRAAIRELAIVTLDPEVYTSEVINGYESDFVE